MKWRSISELSDIYQQPIWIASPSLIDGDRNPLGISDAYWQDTDGPEQGEWRCVDFDMCNDEFMTAVLRPNEVTHFLIPNGPWSADEVETGVDAPWQPIATAPMNVTVDLWVKCGLTPEFRADLKLPAEYRLTDCIQSDEGWIASDGDRVFRELITHWMPLPHPPGAAA